MSTGCLFFATPFNYSAGYPAGQPAGYRISGKTDWPDIRQNRLAGYPANSVSGATLAGIS